jgi:spore coat protein CotH
MGFTGCLIASLSAAAPACTGIVEGVGPDAASPLADAEVLVDAKPMCHPTGGGPHWILEGEALTVPLRCESGLTVSGETFHLANLPAGAVYDPSAKALSFTPTLDQAAVYLIEVEALGETSILKIGVADHWQDPANVPVVDPTLYTEEYGLPVMFLTPGPSADVYAPASVIYRGHTYAAEAKKRGAASLGYPKNSYTLKFLREDKFQEPAHAFRNKRKVVLISTFDDNSYVRQRLAYDLWNLLDAGHIQIQTYSAVVYLGGAFAGLYTVSDHVDGFLMEDFGLRQDGNLYKAVSHDANFRQKGNLHAGFEKKAGVPLPGEPGAFADLDALVTFVDGASAPTFLEEIGRRIDRRDYEDWFIFVTFLLADDSAGKNSYHYHDPLGGLFRFVPWDFNHSFGQTWQTAREAADVSTEYRWNNRLFERFLDEPAIGDALRARYARVLSDLYAPSTLLSLIDGYVAEIDASARRDEARWGAAYRSYGGWSFRDDFTSYEEEIAYLREWVIDRWTFQDMQY